MKQISIKQKTHLEKIRDNRTIQTKATIQEAFKELLQAKVIVTRYKLHKQTNITYRTINKYYKGIVNG